MDPLIELSARERCGTAALVAARRAVLVKLYRRPVHGGKALIDAVEQVKKRWWYLLGALRDLGLESLRNEYAYKRAFWCPPPFFDSGLQPRYCRMRFCPWCYSRQVADVFDRIATTLPGRSLRRSPKTFQYLTYRRDFQNNVSLHEFVAVYNQMALNARRFLEAEGTMIRTVLAPIIGKPESFQSTTTILTVGEAQHWEAIQPLSPRTVDTVVVRHRYELISLVSRACRYPTGMLYGEPVDILQAMRAMRGDDSLPQHRTLTTTGCLRGTKRELMARPRRPRKGRIELP